MIDATERCVVSADPRVQCLSAVNGQNMDVVAWRADVAGDSSSALDREGDNGRGQRPLALAGGRKFGENRSEMCGMSVHATPQGVVSASHANPPVVMMVRHDGAQGSQSSRCGFSVRSLLRLNSGHD